MEFANQDVPLPTKFGMEKLVFVLLISPNITMPVDNVQLEVLQTLLKLHVFAQMRTQSSILLNLPVRFVKPTALLMPIKMLAFVTTDTL